MPGSGRLRAALLALGCRETWTLSPRILRALLKAFRTSRPATAATGTILHVNCPPLGSPGFRRYLRGLRRLAGGEYVPLAVHVAVTGRCINCCARCSNVARACPDPALETLTRMLAGLRDAGTASVALTGGEPLLREDLARLVAACAPDMAPLLFTAGHGLDLARARSLRAAGLVAAFVSLDYFRAEEHDRVRGRSGAFDESLRAIAAFLEAGVYTAAQAVVDEALLADGALEQFLGFCRGLNVHEIMLLTPVPVGPADVCRACEPTEHEHLVRLQLRSVAEPLGPKVTASSWLESPECFGCQAGYGFLYVSAAGDVFPCDFVPVSFGNVFDSGWGPVLERLARCFPVPQQSCMALDLRASLRRTQLPVPWEEAEALLARRPRSGLPGLSQWIAPGTKGPRR
ncbi:MAG: radical SAM protein [Planctomycetota bacterium]|nr:radical SAM protein [Planctomycetota bacterium]